MKKILYYALFAAVLLTGACRSYEVAKVVPKEKTKNKVNPLLPFIDVKSLPYSYFIDPKKKTEKWFFANPNERDIANNKNSLLNMSLFRFERLTSIYGVEVMDNICQIPDEDIKKISPKRVGITELQVTKLKHPIIPFYFFAKVAAYLGGGLIGIPIDYERSSITLKMDVKNYSNDVIKTYTTKGKHTTFNALYWGYKKHDAKEKSHDMAFIKAFNKIKKQMDADAEFLNSKLDKAYMTDDEMQSEDLIKKGNEAYDKKNWSDAIENLAKAKDLIKTFTKDHAKFLYHLGYSYVSRGNEGDMEKGIEALVKSLELDPVVDLMAPASIYIAYRDLGKYEKAGEYLDYALEKFSITKGQKELLNTWKEENNRRIAQVKAGRELMKNPVNVVIANMGGNVNTQYDDYFPSLAADESVLYFTSTREGSTGGLYKGKYDEDLWYCDMQNDGNWSSPKNIGKPVNTENNNGIASITGDGQYVISGRCGETDGFGSCDIYGATLYGTQWGTPENLGRNINSTKWDAQASISADGNTLMWSSNREDGNVIGGSDIWMSKKDTNGKWIKAFNIGMPINTKGTEHSPYLHPDGKTLYFSSDDITPCIGGMDIYKCTLKEDGTWSEPINLGYPINSEKDDEHFVLSPSGLVAYFASNREGGLGGKDIYKITFPDENRSKLITFVGFVFDEETKKPIESDIEIFDLEANKVLGNYKSNVASGKFVVVLTPGKNYSMTVNKKEYLFYSENFNIPLDNAFKEVKKEIYLQKIKVGKKIVLNNIFFDSGLSNLREQSYSEINKIYRIMIENPNIKVEISGHTDNVGNDATNNKLSADRAKVVVDVLLSKGIDPKRIISKGYGKKAPVASNDTEEGRQMNRRTEFKVIE